MNIINIVHMQILCIGYIIIFQIYKYVKNELLPQIRLYKFK